MLNKIKKIEKTKEIGECYKKKLQSIIESLQFFENFLSKLTDFEKLTNKSTIRIYCEETLNSCLSKAEFWEPKIKVLDDELKLNLGKIREFYLKQFPYSIF